MNILLNSNIYFCLAGFTAGALLFGVILAPDVITESEGKTVFKEVADEIKEEADTMSVMPISRPSQPCLPPHFRGPVVSHHRPQPSMSTIPPLRPSGFDYIVNNKNWPGGTNAFMNVFCDRTEFLDENIIDLKCVVEIRPSAEDTYTAEFPAYRINKSVMSTAYFPISLKGSLYKVVIQGEDAETGDLIKKEISGVM